MPAADADTPARRRLSPGERRAQLIALGVDALAEHGIDGIGVDALSERAGVSRALFFHYFGSTEGFRRAVITTARDAMLHATEPRLELPPAARLRDTLERTLGFVRAHDGTFYSLVRGTASGDRAIQRVVEAARVQQTDRVLAVFAELGVELTPVFAIAMRGWLAFVEQVLVDAAHGGVLEDAVILELLVGALAATATRLDPAAAAIAG